MEWRVLTFMVCLYGFLKEYRPSEAYLSAYLTGPWKNLTIEQVDNEIYPVWTYAYLVWLVPVFLLTDYLRYQPVMVLEGVTVFKLMDICYGLVTATEIAYYSYLFAMISEEHYKIITSFTRAAILFGRFAAYLTGQLLVSFDLMDYRELNIISFVSVCLIFLLALTFKRPSRSDIFHRQTTQSKESSNDMNEIGLENQNQDGKFRKGLHFLAKELKEAYSNKTILIWSCFWAFASCGHLQVQNYIQNLWEVITPEDQKGTVYNGAVEAFGTLLSTVSVLAIGFLPINWSRPGLSEIIIAGVCIFNTAVLIVMGQSTEIWVSYTLYSLFRATYHTVITLCTLQIATSLTRQRYGFVFGANMFMALVIETIMTVVVVDKIGLDVDVQTQFTVYGGYFGFAGCLFVVYAVLTLYRNRHSNVTDDDKNMQYVRDQSH